jgi:hypothetical protein
VCDHENIVDEEAIAAGRQSQRKKKGGIIQYSFAD